MSRPKKKIDWHKLDRLAELGLTAEDIANILRLSVDTIYREIKKYEGITFAEYISRRRARGKMSLGVIQLRSARRGNTRMLIWLGMQHLGQSKKGPVDPED